MTGVVLHTSDLCDPYKQNLEAITGPAFRSRPAINHTMSILWVMRMLKLFSPFDPYAHDPNTIFGWKMMELLNREGSRNYERYLCHQVSVRLFK